MYTPGPMNAGQRPVAFQLAEVACRAPLAIYFGAGVSQASPTRIPGGPQLARLCHERLGAILGADAVTCDDPSSLTSVCDAAVAHAGIDLVRRTAIGVAAFTSARPSFGHRVIALLMLEGVVLALTTNWTTVLSAQLVRNACWLSYPTRTISRRIARPC